MKKKEKTKEINLDIDYKKAKPIIEYIIINALNSLINDFMKENKIYKIKTKKNTKKNNKKKMK